MMEPSLPKNASKRSYVPMMRIRIRQILQWQPPRRLVYTLRTSILRYLAKKQPPPLRRPLLLLMPRLLPLPL
jgi:hypothetical protein